MKFSNIISISVIIISVIVLLYKCNEHRGILEVTTVETKPCEKHSTIIPVTINGQTYNFLWDTAGGISSMSDKTAKKLAVEISNTEFCQVFAVNNKQTEQRYYTDFVTIGIGDIEIETRFVVDTRTESNTNEGQCEIDGIIGSDIIKKFSWLFDFTNKTVIVSNKPQSIKLTSCEKSYEMELLFSDSSESSIPHTKIKINDTIDEFFIFDTGLANTALKVNGKTLHQDMIFLLSDDHSFEQVQTYVDNKYTKNSSPVMVTNEAEGVFLFDMKLNEYDPTLLYVSVEFDKYFKECFNNIAYGNGLTGAFLLGSGFLKRFSRMYYDANANRVSLIISASDTSLNENEVAYRNFYDLAQKQLGERREEETE